MESENLKAIYRKTFKANLQKTKLRGNLYALDYRIQKHLKKILQEEIGFHKRHHKRPMNLLFFLPLPLEFDTRKLLGFFRRQRGIRVCCPLMCGESFKAVKFRLPLHKKTFGVYESSNSCLHLKIDCAIVPVLGIDKSFRRVGFGKGMYDRFFASRENTHQSPKILFICRHFNYAKTIITQDYDIRGDLLITPQQCHFPDSIAESHKPLLNL
ncbi:5-formyltetrahydrofolate cyclo-ligase [Helicobacter sp. MIT 05-5294]|uniref:5-formyltetrahydrofolate cyclo-ligase n=1 Tax=Helicobacter sp. MIT 05-5294 TaxID=1548150 RepID=UPI000AE66983|nr:5-formyltetrahydrofolate cyclo-ligase [Helicobacter sp. MIT 05-5294]